LSQDIINALSLLPAYTVCRFIFVVVFETAKHKLPLLLCYSGTAAAAAKSRVYPASKAAVF